MIMDFKKLFLISLIVAVILPAQVFGFKVTCNVDKTKISKDDSIFLKLVVDGGKADLDLSMIKDFKVISRGSSSSYKFINGKSTRQAIYRFVLIPLKKGKLKIPSIKAEKNGQTAFTREIGIQVSEQAVDTDDTRGLFAKAFVRKKILLLVNKLFIH